MPQMQRYGEKYKWRFENYGDRGRVGNGTINEIDNKQPTASNRFKPTITKNP